MAGEMIIHDDNTNPPDPAPGKLATQAMRGKLPVADLLTFAQAMAKSPLVPFHLRRTGVPDEIVANCFIICSQAFAWGMDPISVASQCYVIDGKMSYQGKLIAALVNTRAGLKERMKVTFSGAGPELTCTVAGQFKSEKQPRTKTLKRRDVEHKSELWKRDPENKLFYTTVLAWASLHWPEGVLGISYDPEVEVIDNISVNVEVTRGVHQEDEIPQEAREEKVAESRPAQEGDRQTLQDALGQQAAAVAAMDAPAAGDRIDFQLLQRVKASLEILFGLKGIDHTPEGFARQKEVIAAICAKQGVKRLEDLTNAQGLELEGKIESQVNALHAAKKDAAQKH